MSRESDYYHRVTKHNLVAMAKKRAVEAAKRAAMPRSNPIHWVARLIPCVKHRAKQDGVRFDLTVGDIYVPEYCPVFGVRLLFGHKYHPDGASLDRIIPDRGYVKGNVAVISRRANMIKQDATAAQIRQVANWLEAQNVG